eukprot:5203503-Pleurochrysis_carterae.AAC.2
MRCYAVRADMMRTVFRLRSLRDAMMTMIGQPLTILGTDMYHLAHFTLTVLVSQLATDNRATATDSRRGRWRRGPGHARRGGMSLLKRNAHDRRGGSASGDHAGNGSPLQCRGGSAHSSAGPCAGTPNSRAAKLQSLLAQTQGIEGSPVGTGGCSTLGSYGEGYPAASQFSLAGRPTSAIVGMRNAGFTGHRTVSSTVDATKQNASSAWLGSVSSTASGKNAAAPACAVSGAAANANAAAGAAKGATGAYSCDALTERGGVPIVLRSTAEKLANPERLNLDRRSLEVLPPSCTSSCQSYTVRRMACVYNHSNCCHVVMC